MRHRKQYPGLAGKIVECVDSFEEYGKVNVRVRFADDTEPIVVIAPQPPRITAAQLLRWKRGNSSVVRSYTKPR